MKNGAQDQDKEGVQMLSISDWISFLSSEKHSNTSNVIGFGSFMLVAGIAILVRVTTDNIWITVFVVVPTVIILIAIWLKIILPIRYATEVARDLLDNIMDGTERDLAKIEEKWKKRKSKKD